jgi:hypothetical protein
MKRLGAVLGGAAAVISVAAAAQESTQRPTLPAATIMSAAGWTAMFASEARYFSWQSDRGFAPRDAPANTRGSGSEFYLPFALQVIGRPSDDFKFELLGRGGWVEARQSTTGFAGEVSTMTDTVVSSTVTYFGFNGIQPFVALNLNIPTGKSSLPGTAANARMDPDLVEIASFGEGFNIGPTIGFNLPITSNLIVTTSAGYTWRGKYDRESSLAPFDPTVPVPGSVDPGDVFTIQTSVGYQLGQFASTITGSVSWETATKENGMVLYRPGIRYLLSGKWSYTWPDVGVTTLTAAASHSQLNEVLFLNVLVSSFGTEPFNTNSNVYRIGLEHLFPVGQLWLGPTGSYLHRDHNGYDSGTLQFVPAKERLSAGVLARYAANEKVTLNARVERVWTHLDEDPATGSPPARPSVLQGGGSVAGIPVPVVSSTGWQASVGANVKF